MVGIATPRQHGSESGQYEDLEVSELLVASRRRRVEGVPRRTWVGAPEPSDAKLSWGVFDFGFLLVLGAIVALNATDLVVTLYETLRVGWAAEGNVVMRMIGATGGPWLFAAIKVLAIGAAVPIMWRTYRLAVQALATARARHEVTPARRNRAFMLGSTAALALFYVWVVQNNLRIVGL